MQGTFELKVEGKKADIQTLLDYLATTEYSYLFEDPVKWGIIPKDFDELPDDANTWLHTDTDTSGSLNGVYELMEECAKRFPALMLDYWEDALDYPGRSSYHSEPGCAGLSIGLDEAYEPFSPSSKYVFYLDEMDSILHIPEGETELLEDSGSWEGMENGDFAEYCSCSVTIPKSIKRIGNQAFGRFYLREVYIPSSTVELDEKAFYRDHYHWEYVKTFVIHAPAGSTAEAYVKKHGEEYGIEFEAL